MKKKQQEQQEQKEKLVKQLRNDVIRDLKSLINGVETLAEGIERDYPTFLKFENEETYLKILKDFYHLENIYSFLNGNFIDKLFLSLAIFKEPEKFETKNIIVNSLNNLIQTYKTKKKTSYQNILNTLETLELELLVEISKVAEGKEKDLFQISIYTKYVKKPEPVTTSFDTYNKEYFKKSNKNDDQVEEAYKRFLKENLEQELFLILPKFIKQFNIKNFSVFSLETDLEKILYTSDICEKLNKLCDEEKEF